MRGRDAHLGVHLLAWCRAQGLQFAPAERAATGTETGGGVADDLVGFVTRQTDQAGRWRGAERAGEARAGDAGVVSQPPRRWGLAARGAAVEAGGPEYHFALGDKRTVWADEAARLYEQAAAAQWDPATAIPWAAPCDLPDEVEDAVVQVMTYLIENETAALVVPARFLAQLHPHFREVMQLLAVQTADEARHIEVFTRRALLHRDQLGLSTVGGQLSLKTLVDEPDFALASFLLSVLGEGSFLSLLWFLHRHAPDPVTAEVARLAAQDEARHVAFGLAHLTRHAGEEPGLRARLAAAVERRHDALRHTAGLNEEVFDALVLHRRRIVAARGDRARPRRGGRAGARHGRGPPAPAAAARLHRRRGAGAVEPAHSQLHVKRVEGAGYAWPVPSSPTAISPDDRCLRSMCETRRRIASAQRVGRARSSAMPRRALNGAA